MGKVCGLRLLLWYIELLMNSGTPDAGIRYRVDAGIRYRVACLSRCV